MGRRRAGLGRPTPRSGLPVANGKRLSRRPGLEAKRPHRAVGRDSHGLSPFLVGRRPRAGGLHIRRPMFQGETTLTDANLAERRSKGSAGLQPVAVRG